MKTIFSLLILVMCGGLVFGQTTSTQPKWAGSWKLNKEKTTIDKDDKVDWASFNQTMKLELVGKQIKLDVDTLASDKKPHVLEEQLLSLDGTERIINDMTYAFKRIDAITFDIVGNVNNKDVNGTTIDHFVCSPDGKRLTETRTRIYREVAPAGTDPAKSKVVWTRTSTFVFDRP